MWTKSTSKLFSDKGWVLGAIVALYLVIAALYLVRRRKGTEAPPGALTEDESRRIEEILKG